MVMNESSLKIEFTNSPFMLTDCSINAICFNYTTNSSPSFWLLFFLFSYTPFLTSHKCWADKHGQGDGIAIANFLGIYGWQFSIPNNVGEWKIGSKQFEDLSQGFIKKLVNFESYQILSRRKMK